MEHLSVKKAINLARNFGAAGVLAAALVMTSGCSQADDHQTAVRVADSDNAQEDGVYGKMKYSVTGVEVHDSPTGDGGKLPLFAGTPLTTDRQIHALLVATSRLIKISRCYLAGLPPICRKITSLRKGLRREANATVCRFLTSTTCLPSK